MLWALAVTKGHTKEGIQNRMLHIEEINSLRFLNASKIIKDLKYYYYYPKNSLVGSWEKIGNLEKKMSLKFQANKFLMAGQSFSGTCLMAQKIQLLMNLFSFTWGVQKHAEELERGIWLVGYGTQGGHGQLFHIAAHLLVFSHQPTLGHSCSTFSALIFAWVEERQKTSMTSPLHRPDFLKHQLLVGISQQEAMVGDQRAREEKIGHFSHYVLCFWQCLYPSTTTSVKWLFSMTLAFTRILPLPLQVSGWSQPLLVASLWVLTVPWRFFQFCSIKSPFTLSKLCPYTFI